MRRFAYVFAGFWFLVVSAATAQEVMTALSAEQIQEALALAADEKAAARFLDAYVVQPRAGWGNGPLIGVFTTPFSRVVRAAVQARRRKVSFSVDDIRPELLVPEVQVVATAQKGWPDETMVATVQSVVLVHRTAGSEEIVQPLRTTELSPALRSLHGIESADAGVMVSFPMTQLTAGATIRVTYDRTARGFSGMSMCRDCLIPLDLRRIR